jgi:hypothetical protein
MSTATLGTDLGFDSKAPLDAEYIVSGYINDRGKTLYAGEKLPMDSPLRESSDLLLTEMRVGRLRLAPAKVATASKAAATPESKTKPTKSKR